MSRDCIHKDTKTTFYLPVNTECMMKTTAFISAGTLADVEYDLSPGSMLVINHDDWWEYPCMHKSIEDFFLHSDWRNGFSPYDYVFLVKVNALGLIHTYDKKQFYTNKILISQDVVSENIIKKIFFDIFRKGKYSVRTLFRYSPTYNELRTLKNKWCGRAADAILDDMPHLTLSEKEDLVSKEAWKRYKLRQELRSKANANYS